MPPNQRGGKAAEKGRQGATRGIELILRPERLSLNQSYR